MMQDYSGAFHVQSSNGHKKMVFLYRSMAYAYYSDKAKSQFEKSVLRI